ncbi:MAG: Fic family protein [Anaerolineae bacterium]|nr:Fic family protein [Anaerolineae bacterium]
MKLDWCTLPGVWGVTREVDPERFRDSTAGRLIWVGRGQEAYWAFVPHELPPDLDWDSELALVLAEAERSLGELKGLGRTMPNPHLPVGPFIRREAVFSSRIEGIETDIADLYAYEAGQLSLPGLGRPGVSESDVWEVLNYVRALEYGLERMGTSPVSLRLIRQLHLRLMGGVLGERATPGEFRRSQNWIGRPGSTLHEADFVPPPPAEMRTALDAFEKYLHGDDQYPSLVRLALVHYQFEAIHPFVDGNGRIGRLLVSLLLVHWWLLPLPLLHLSAFFERHSDEYYELLIGVSERGAWKAWLAFFLRGVAEQSGDAMARAKQLQDLQLDWRGQLEDGGAPEWILGLADLLFETPLVSAQMVRKRFGVSHPTAMEGLRRLEGMGILRQITGTGRNNLYLATAVVKGVE